MTPAAAAVILVLMAVIMAMNLQRLEELHGARNPRTGSLQAPSSGPVVGPAAVDETLRAQIAALEQSQSRILEAVIILRDSLREKDDQLRLALDLASDRHLEIMLRRTIKQIGFLGNLKLQLAESKIDGVTALDFLAGESEDLIAEHDIQVFSPEVGVQLTNLPGDLIEIARTEVVQHDAANPGPTVGAVQSRGLYRPLADGSRTVFQKSRIIVHKPTQV